MTRTSSIPLLTAFFCLSLAGCGKDAPKVKKSGEDDAPTLDVHRTGSPDTDASNLLHREITLIHHVADAAGDAFDDAFRTALGLGADLDAGQAFVVRFEDAREDLGSAEVNPDEVSGFAAAVCHAGLVVN